MPGNHAPTGPFVMPMINSWVPRKIQPWIYILFALSFQLTGFMYTGATSHVMGDTCLMREDVTMIALCAVVGVNMPFPFLFRFKFRFTNRQLLINAALCIAACNILCTFTENIVVLCILSYISGFFKLCGSFECFSNIRTWMTRSSDPALFFPILFSVVVGAQSLSPWLSVQFTYIFQSWKAMQWIMAGWMCFLALVVYLITHPFRFMRPLPLVSLDWLGCFLCSALCIEIIFLFNYGEFYNWWDGATFRIVACMVPVTAYIAFQRMRHIRHPYIEPNAWKYKRLVPLLTMFFIIEIINSTPNVLQNSFTGSVLHFGNLATSRFYLIAWIGTLCGSYFIIFWVKVLRQKYTRLLTLGMAVLMVYVGMMYFQVMPGLDIVRFYLPTFCRAFGYAIFFIVLTIYLNDLMPFPQFFMGLTMIGFVRTGVGETVCSGVYGYFLRHGIADNMARGLPYDATQAMMIAIKQLYGVTCILGTIVLLFFLLWDIQPVRTTLKRMHTWNVLGRFTRRMLRS